jgi:hypothetical protein
MFKELESISNEIIETKNQIIKKNELFNQIKSLCQKPNEENEKFFKNLEDYVQLYNQKFINLNQGTNFYNEFNLRLNEINEKITDYLFARDLEKNEIIKTITSGQNVQLANYNNQSGKIFF